MIEEVEDITTTETTMIETTEITEAIETEETTETTEITEITETTEMVVKETTITITKVETEIIKDTKKRTLKMTTKWISNFPTRVKEEVEDLKEKNDHQKKSLKFQMKIWVNFLERTLNSLFKLKSITSILMNKMMKKKKRTRMNQSQIRSQEDTISKFTHVSQIKMERKKQ